MSGPGDLLLRWASELGAGELPELKQGMWWLAAKSCPEADPSAPGRWLRDAVSLGYLDVDWRNRRWCAAPPVLTGLPRGRGLAVLTGSRTAAFEAQLEEAAATGLVELYRVPSSRPDQDIPLPDSLVIQYDDAGSLAEWAAGLGVSYSPCFAIQAAALLPPLTPGERTSAPEFGAPLEMYALDQHCYLPVQRPRDDGLYRLRRRDSKRVCQLLHNGDWFETTHEYGVYTALGQRSTDAGVLRWIPEPDCGRERFGTLFVDWGFPLPDLQRRVAALCSGLAPRINGKAENLAYDNMPQAVAQKIASTLGQRLGDSNA